MMTSLSKKTLFIFLLILLMLNGLVILGFSQPVKEFIHGASASATSSEVINYSVKKGNTFASVLKNFGFTHTQANKILRDASDEYDFTNITRGNLFQFVLSDGKVQKVKYDIDNTEQVVLDRQNSSSSFSAHTQKIPYKRKTVVASTTINESLFSDATKKGIPDKIVLQLAEILAWDIDFSAEIKKGDKFVVVYQKLFRDGHFVGPGRILATKFKNQGENHWAFYFEDKKTQGKYYDLKGKSVMKQFLKSPLNYSYISSGFSYNRLNPVTRSYGAHRAVDYAAPPGTPVYATGDGRVAYAGWSDGKGLFVKIKHGGVYSTTYAHLSGVADGVRTGTPVSQGQVIGYVGSTGMSTGAHLHYVMKRYGRHINPLTYDLPEGEPLPEDKKQEFQKVVDKYKPLLQ